MDLDLELASFRSKMGGGKLVPEKSWWGKNWYILKNYTCGQQIRVGGQGLC